MKDFKIKLDTYEHENNILKGKTLTLQEYALLRDTPYQEVVEEFSEKNSRTPYRKAIYLKELRKIFVYGEKPKYNYLEAQIFRLNLMLINPKKNYDITQEDGMSGYWINKKEYAELTRTVLSTVTKQIQSKTLEFGQIVKKPEKEYQFFIPIEPEPFDYKDLQILITKLDQKKQEEQIKDLKLVELKQSANKFAQIIGSNPRILDLLDELSDLSLEQICALKEIGLNLTPEDVKKLKTMSKGFEKLFG